MARWSLHPGSLAPPWKVSDSEEEPEVTVFNPEAGAVDGNPFPEELQAEEVVEEIDYNSLLVAQLRELLEERGLPVSGVKAELIARLEADDAGPSEEALAESEEAPSEEAASSDGEPEEGDVSEYGEQENS